MDYKNVIKAIEDKSYLISMSTLESLIELGYSLEFNNDTSILDICCGYGEMLKIWSEAFGVKGLGVELFDQHVKDGNERLVSAGISEKVKIVQGDAKKFETEERFDVVCLSGEDLFNGIVGNIQHCEKYLKPNGVIIIGTPYYKSKEVPKELIEFEGDLPTLGELYTLMSDVGYNVLHFCSDTIHEWERYISWSGKRDIHALKKLQDDEKKQKKQEWIDYWYKMYFDYRIKYEGWVVFALAKR